MSKKMVFAHLLTWFQTKEYSTKWEMWDSKYKNSIHNPDIILENGKRDIASKSYPLIGVYDSNDPKVIEYQLLTMKLAGIDGVIIDWDGRNINTYRHLGLMNVLPYIKKFDMKLIVCFEEWSGYWPISKGESRQTMIDKALRELAWLNEQIISDDSHVKISGKAPVLVFRKIPTHWFKPDEWDFIKTETKSYNIEYLFNDIYDESFRNVADGYFTWVSGFDQDSRVNTLEYYQNEIDQYMNQRQQFSSKKTFFGSVLPGFDDSPVNGWGDGKRIAPRYGLKRYQKSWDIINSEKIDLVQIVTWNDWNEGSQIEPCDKYGYTYVIETKRQISRFKGEDNSINEEILRLPLKLYFARMDMPNDLSLDNIAKAISNLDYQEAISLLKKIEEK